MTFKDKDRYKKLDEIGSKIDSINYLIETNALSNSKIIEDYKKKLDKLKVRYLFIVVANNIPLKNVPQESRKYVYDMVLSLDREIDRKYINRLQNNKKKNK